MDIKPTIKDMLVRFDEYSNRLGKLQATNGSNGKGNATGQDLLKLEEYEFYLLKKIEDEEYIERNLVNDAHPNMKKIEKQMAKVQQLRATREDCLRRIKECKAENACQGIVQDLRDAYKMLLAGLQDFRQKYPDDYVESERETGIFFLTTPR